MEEQKVRGTIYEVRSGNLEVRSIKLEVRGTIYEVVSGKYEVGRWKLGVGSYPLKQIAMSFRWLSEHLAMTGE